MGIHVNPDLADTRRLQTRDFLALDYSQYGRSVVSFNPSEAIIISLVAEATQSIGAIASLDKVMEVYRHNPETIFAFAREAWREAPNEGPVGFFCHLPLTRDGYDALFDGRLDTRAPDTQFIARQHERPAAIYLWGVQIPREVAGGIALFAERLTSAKFAGLPIHMRAATAKGLAFFGSLGFREGATHRGRKRHDLLTYVPPDPAAGRASYDSYVPGVAKGTKTVAITVAHTLHDLHKVLIIRGAAFIGDRFLPFDDDADGNDFAGTHLLGYVGDEPAGCIRIRYFADFVKLERLAVLAPHRNSQLGVMLIKAALSFCQEKGYRRFYGHASHPYTRLWKKFGFAQRGESGFNYLTEETYFEMDMELPAPASRLTPESGPMTLMRPEGQWARPGVLEEAMRHPDVVNPCYGDSPQMFISRVPVEKGK